MRFFACLALIFLTGCATNTVDQSEHLRLKVGDKEVNIEIAESNEEKEKGLSGREFLPEDLGMLFTYEKKTVPGFWMKGMKIPIDIIWINQGTIIGIEHSVPVHEGPNLPIYKPSESVNWVLEVNAGWATKNEVKVGDKVHLIES